MNESIANGKNNNRVTIKGQYAVIAESNGYGVINIHNKLVIADEIASVEEAIKILEYLNEEVNISRDRGSIDKLPVKSAIKEAIRNYAPATAKVEKKTNLRGVVYKCYDAAGNYLGQIKENF